MGVGAHRLIDGNRMGADSCAPVGPAAASGPGFHIRWQPSGPRVSARAIPVSADGRGPPADDRVPRFTMNFCVLVSEPSRLPRVLFLLPVATHSVSVKDTLLHRKQDAASATRKEDTSLGTI